jgi:protein SCO1/2
VRALVILALVFAHAAAAARVLFVSVDPAETAADAADKRRAGLGYARLLDGVEPVDATTIERVVGLAASIAALASRVGFVYQPGDATARFAHPAGVVVVTPDGRVSHYLMGVRFDPAELRTPIEDARDGQVGNLSDRLALLCAHLDPRTSVHSEAVLVGMRIAGLATLASLVWRSTAAGTVRRCRGTRREGRGIKRPVAVCRGTCPA